MLKRKLELPLKTEGGSWCEGVRGGGRHNGVPSYLWLSVAAARSNSWLLPARPARAFGPPLSTSLFVPTNSSSGETSRQRPSSAEMNRRIDDEQRQVLSRTPVTVASTTAICAPPAIDLKRLLPAMKLGTTAPAITWASSARDSGCSRIAAIYETGQAQTVTD